MSVSEGVLIGVSVTVLVVALLLIGRDLGQLTAAVRQLQALAHWHEELPLPPAPETSRPTTNSGPKSVL